MNMNHIHFDLIYFLAFLALIKLATEKIINIRLKTHVIAFE